MFAVVISLVSLQASAAVPLPETKDKVNSVAGVLRGGALFTPDAGGHTGTAGDYAIDFKAGGSGPVYVQDAGFMNTAAQNDEVSVAFWTKKYDIADGSAFWFNSPSSSGTFRGFQAHVPWSDDNIYFDTAGCCDADTQRISDNIVNFGGYTGDDTWWTDDWHFFVFTKKADVKQVWIDGQLFLEGSGANPLPTDFTDLYIGSDGAGGGLFHALVDDFAVFGTALTDASINQLYTGTSPSDLPATAKLLAYWDFNEPPASGAFVSVYPAPDSAAGAPDLVRVVHIDGAVHWDASSVTLKVDDAAVTPTFTTNDAQVTLSYVPDPIFAAQSAHSVALTYPAGGGQQATFEWEFKVGPYTKDAVASRVGVFQGASYTVDAGGHTGQAGDYAVDFGNGRGPVYVHDGALLNTATANDEMSFVLWVKKYDIAASSAFWANSPSSNNGQRGFQAHIPWSDDNIYFDTAGCCDASLQRINDNIANFGGYSEVGDDSWWTNSWHLFVFSKKADDKQVWIDGQLFLEASNSDPLPTDMTDLYLGAAGDGTSVMHGLMDDFAVFGTQLSGESIQALYTGTAPGALPASDKLMAFWNFNDLPAEGLFVSFSPAPSSTNAVPNLVKVVHQEGTTPWDLSKVSLSVDGSAVTATSVLTNGTVSVTYVPSPIFTAFSSHTAVLTYPNPDGSAQTTSWDFTVSAYTKDTVGSYIGSLTGAAKFTPDAGGHSGQAGDYGMDFGPDNAGQGVDIVDATFLNAAAADDQMSIVSWQKLYSVADSAIFWGISPSSNGSSRGFSAHTPWSNNNLYFDTAGCCDTTTQRISGPIDDFPTYTGDPSWWQDWHHLVFQKNGSTKQIWIDGILFLEGDNSNPLPTDFTEAWLGFDPPDNAHLRGIIDDFAVFSTALDETTLGQLANGTLPSALPASAGLVAYWNFNDPPVGGANPPTLDVAHDPSGVKVTFTGTLQSADVIAGPWTDVVGATSPAVYPTAGTAKYYRAKQ